MRVLLVEDDPATAQIAEMMLKSESYVCDVTDMGEDGLEISKLYDYDIIVLDLLLPDMDGYEVLRRLRAARVKTPILILSGLNGLDDKIKGTTLTKEVFLNDLYGGVDEPELKIIDVFVCKLRKKLTAATAGENYIETVWGRGYVLRDPAPVEETVKGEQQAVAANG